MSLPVLTFQQYVDQQASLMKASSPYQLNFNQGSVILALLQSNAGNSIWLQSLATTLLATTRLSTSTGTDVDTFIADYDFTRYQGNPSFGLVTFSRFTATITGVVPVGSIVSVSLNNLQFIVTADTGNAFYNAGLNSYILPISQFSMSVPVKCTTSGTIGNIAVGAIDTINNNVPVTVGIDNVTNPSAFTNGANPWSDTETKQQFVLYINSLSRATYQAIAFAVSTTTNGGEVVTRYNIVENFNEMGSPQLGYFYVIIDNGTGSTVTTALLDNVIASVEAYRGLTIAFDVTAATFITPTVIANVHLVAQPTETNAVIKANVMSGIQAYANSIPFNQPMLFSKLVEAIYNSDPNIATIASPGGVLLNAGSSDLAGNNLQVFSVPSGNITVNIV